MPSKSKAQHNLMETVAHNPAFAAQKKIPQNVAAEFVQADKASGSFRGKTRETMPEHVRKLDHRKIK